MTAFLRHGPWSSRTKSDRVLRLLAILRDAGMPAEALCHLQLALGSGDDRTTHAIRAVDCLLAEASSCNGKGTLTHAEGAMVKQVFRLCGRTVEDVRSFLCTVFPGARASETLHDDLESARTRGVKRRAAAAAALEGMSLWPAEDDWDLEGIIVSPEDVVGRFMARLREAGVPEEHLASLRSDARAVLDPPEVTLDGVPTVADAIAFGILFDSWDPKQHPRIFMGLWTVLRPLLAYPPFIKVVASAFTELSRLWPKEAKGPVADIFLAFPMLEVPKVGGLSGSCLSLVCLRLIGCCAQDPEAVAASFKRFLTVPELGVQQADTEDLPAGPPIMASAWHELWCAGCMPIVCTRTRRPMMTGAAPVRHRALRAPHRRGRHRQ